MVPPVLLVQLVLMVVLVLVWKWLRNKEGTVQLQLSKLQLVQLVILELVVVFNAVLVVILALGRFQTLMLVLPIVRVTIL